MILYEIRCDYYQDTRMGASNPYFKVGNTVRTLDECKKEIIKYFKKKHKEINLDFEIKNSKWFKDFEPEIMSIKKIKIK